MTLAELRAQFRAEADDEVLPFFWSDLQVKNWLNEAEEEAASRASLLPEDADPAVCSIAVVANTAVYATHAAILDITRATFTPTGSDAITLFLIDRIELDRIKPDWRTATDDPAYLVQDDTKIRIVPAPTTAGVLLIECNRLPLVPMAADDDTPEIASSHHRRLVHWALHRAFSKPDSETIDAGRAAAAERDFTAYFGIRPDADTRKAAQANRPHFNKAVW